jgi:hypothetical protein
MNEHIALDLLPPALVRRRARGVAIFSALLAAAAGGVVGLVGGRGAGLVAAAVVGLPLLLLALAEARRRTWLDGQVVVVRAIGVRRVGVCRAARKDLLVSEVRGQRTVSLLLSEPGGKTVTVALAIYTAAGGVELGILPLRRLADTLAACADDEAATVLSRLLVAQLRAEARGEPLPERPLHLAAGLVEAGRVVRKVNHGRLAALVAECS